jgi:hypothetical protein
MTFIRPAPIMEPESLASGPVTCPAAQETELVNRRSINGYWCYLTHLAFYVAGSTTLVEFRTYIGNALAQFPYQRRNTSLASIGSPQELPFPCFVPPEVPVSIRAFNGDSGPLSCESDGYLNYYDRRIR